MNTLIPFIGMVLLCGYFVVYRPMQRRKRCTDSVPAKCVGMKTFGGMRTVYFEGKYQGQTRRFMVTGDMFSRYTIGEEATIYVNPDNMKDFYCSKTKDHLFFAAFILCIVIFYIYIQFSK